MSSQVEDDTAGDEQRRSLWQFLLHPIASYDDLMETLQSSSDTTYKEIGYTIAVALNVILLMSKFALPHAWRLPFGVGLLLLSCAFAWRFFTKKKLYRIYKREGSLPIKSPNVRVAVTSPRKLRGPASRNDITEVCDLMLWDPPIISQTVFCLFSPLQVAVVLVADDSDLMASIFSLVFAAIIAISITFMCNVFTTWKNDQEVIFREVYDEQNRFMLSQTARPKADAAIQADAVDTHETSLLYPAYPPTVIVVPPTPVQTTPRSFSAGPRSSAGAQTTPSSLTSPTSTARKRKKSVNPFQQGDM